MTMTKQEAGRLGGLKTFQLYGSDYMRSLGRKGAISFWSKYKLVPFGASDFSIVEKSTGKVIATMNGYHVLATEIQDDSAIDL